MHITIGIPVFNQEALTKKCVDSILLNTNYDTYDLLFIDNGSADETKEYLKKLCKFLNCVQVITNEKNLGFPKACNQILDNFTGDAVVILNNDTIVPENWLQGLSEQLKNDVGMVGCKIINPSGQMVHAGAEIIHNKIEHFDYPGTTLVDLVNGACMLISRSLVNTKLRFDESYGLGYFEEFTYEIEAKKLGFKIAYVPSVIVTHLVNGTSSKIVDAQALIKKNWLKFCKRYGIESGEPKQKLLLVGFDTPNIPTGFASTCNSISQGFIEKGYDVYSIAGNLEVKENFNYKGINVLSNTGSMYPTKETFLKYYNEIQPFIVIFHNDIYRIPYIVDLDDSIKDKSALWLPVEKNGITTRCIAELNRLKHVAVVSDFAFNALKDKVSCNLYKVYHQVDTNIFKPLFTKNDLRKKEGFDSFFTVIRNDRNQPRKLWGLTFKVWQQFSKDKKDVKLIAKTAAYDCVGKDLVKVVKKLGIEDSVVFNADHVTRERLNELYNLANVFLSTSGSEGFGLAIAEASSAGLPVVAPRYQPIEELLNFGISGKLIDIKEQFYHQKMHTYYDIIDIDNAVKHLNDLYDDWKSESSLLEHMSSVGREYVVDRYDVKKVVDSWCDVFSKMEDHVVKKIKGVERLEIGIVTHNRQDYLSCLLTSLLAQTYQNFDITIVDNNDDESMINNPLVMSLLRRFEVSGHTWRLWRGNSKDSFPTSHQKIFEGTKCNYVFKLDDDLILDNYCLEKLMNTIKADDNIAAVGGIFLQPVVPMEEQRLPPEITPTMNILNNNVQWYKHPTSTIMEAEHLYSSYIYRKNCMKEISGFPMNLSKLAFREDTITTHKMYKKGHKLYIVPEAILFHFQNSRGGVHAIDDSNKRIMAEGDSRIFDEQLKLLNK